MSQIGSFALLLALGLSAYSFLAGFLALFGKDAASARLGETARRAGIAAPRIGAHAFRHSHASRQVDAGANLKVVSDILGHRSPSSTSVYVRVALARLRTVALPVPR